LIDISESCEGTIISSKDTQEWKPIREAALARDLVKKSWNRPVSCTKSSS